LTTTILLQYHRVKITDLVPQTLQGVSFGKEVTDMLPGSWAKRTFSKETFTFALSLASLFLVLGLLFYWVHMALQSP
jgi:hypothetical protein